MKQLLGKWLRSLGYEVVRAGAQYPDLSADDKRILELIRPFTMTSVERQIALIHATRYVARSGIAGAIAECGVWRGGSMMAVAATLLSEGVSDRDLYLYDTFEGMPAPPEVDKRNDGTSAAAMKEELEKGGQRWCHASIQEVRHNLRSTGYPENKVHLVPGRVEDTIPKTMPGPLALLRLDTDWYESTKHELVHLYPLLAVNGILIIDDYGYWQGARKAVDEYFTERGVRLYLHRVDDTGRGAIKTA
ncbi:MAG: TylF/MycF family methyltransferase [Verrucomicrobiae bacterium]|nr:TylF/MycF family methyltransferase [Verrucomicrobiae bacterium]